VSDAKVKFSGTAAHAALTVEKVAAKFCLAIETIGGHTKDKDKPIGKCVFKDGFIYIDSSYLQ
jgi:hypothetical protein